MENSCSSSDLFRPNFARNKRPRDDVGMDFGIPLTAKRCKSKKKKIEHRNNLLEDKIHFLSEINEKPDAPYGCLARPEALSKTVATAAGETLESDACSMLHSVSKMLKEDDSQILNLSKSENGGHSVRSRGSPEDELMENVDEQNLPMDLSKGCNIEAVAGLPNEIDEYKATNCIGNGLSHFNYEKTIEKLVEELRNEETILVLLKKIRQSQLLHRLIKDGVDSTRLAGISAQPMSGPPPPLVQSLQSRFDAHHVGHHRTVNDGSRPFRTSPSVAQQTHSLQPPMVPLRLSAADATVSINRSALNDPSSTTASQTGHRSLAYLPTSSSSHAQPDRAAGQNQAAAKVALRKQLEKTLLQIPPPKPPPPEMNFIPNVGNGDFVTLLGLEEAVKCILDNDARAGGESVSEVKYVFSPFQCVQCQTDFTPVWKRDKPGSKNVICERCVTNNQKLVLKQEHTNRLKSAFVKALQQEQEIDQSLLTQSTATVPLAHTLHPSPHSSSALSKSSSNIQRSELETAQHPSRHRHLQQQHHHLLPSPRQSTTLWTPPTVSGAVGTAQAFDPRLMFAFHRPQVNSKSSVDLQRQYLLDLIPRRSHLDGPVLWRT